MLYDEEGKAYVEPPLLPEEQLLHYIVKDYRRMFIEDGRIKKRNKRLAETNSRLNTKCYWQQGRILQLTDALRHCVKLLRKNGVQQTEFLANFLKEKNIK